jgi:hypothetical protein
MQSRPSPNGAGPPTIGLRIAVADGADAAGKPTATSSAVPRIASCARADSVTPPVPPECSQPWNVPPSLPHGQAMP